MRSALALLVVPAAALAQPVPPAEPIAEPAPVVQSVLPQLFATAPGTTAEVRIDYSDLDGLDANVFGLLAHVQYLTPQGFGGYVRIPFGYVEDNDTLGLGGSGLGNLEIGGLYTTKLSPQTDLLVRGGVSLDTASEEDSLAVALSTILPRLVDTYGSGFETTWARPQLQLRHAIGNLRFGGAAGFDLPIAGEGADAEGFNGILHVIASAGLQEGQLGLGVSFVMLQPFSDGDDENVTGLNLGGDYLVNPNARLFLQIGLSLEDNADGTSIGAGTRVTF